MSTVSAVSFSPAPCTTAMAAGAAGPAPAAAQSPVAGSAPMTSMASMSQSSTAHAMFSAFENVFGSDDPIRALAALIMLATLFGEKDEDQSKTGNVAAGLIAGLLLAGQNQRSSPVLEASMSLTFSQQSASAAYHVSSSADAGAGSSLSLLG